MKKAAGIAGGAVTLRVHVTGDAGDEERSVNSPSEKMSTSEGDASPSATISTANGRPDIRSIVSEKGKTCTGQVGVAGTSHGFHLRIELILM